MYIIPKYKFAFLAAPRTGSKAVAKALMEQRGAILIGSHHSTPDEHPEIEIDRDWLVCSATRGHWDTMISWWFKIDRRGKMRPLSEFLPQFCMNNPSYVKDYQLWWKTLPHTNKVLRYEWLQADIDHALVTVGLAPVELPKITDSKRGGAPYQRFYKQATAKWVANYFDAEIAKCGYKF